MTSLREKEGRALLHKWYINSELVRVSFSTMGDGMVVYGFGKIASLHDESFRLEGESGFFVLVALKDAEFENVVSRISLDAGLDPDRYSESLEIICTSGDKIVFFVRPKEEERPN